MTTPINLNKARKAKAREDKEQRARENRLKFGRTKAQKAADRLQARQGVKDLDGKTVKPD